MVFFWLHREEEPFYSLLRQTIDYECQIKK